MQCKNKSRLWEKGLRRRDTINFILVHYKGLHPVFSAPLAKKVPLTQIIVHIQLINQFLLPVEIKNPAKLINCSPQLPIILSRNTILTQFLLPVEIKNPAKLINCSPQLPINFSRNTRLTPIAQTSTIVQWLSQNYNEYNTNLDSNRIKKGWENSLIGTERKACTQSWRNPVAHLSQNWFFK